MMMVVMVTMMVNVCDDDCSPVAMFLHPVCSFTLGVYFSLNWQLVVVQYTQCLVRSTLGV